MDRSTPSKVHPQGPTDLATDDEGPDSEESCGDISYQDGYLSHGSDQIPCCNPGRGEPLHDGPSRKAIATASPDSRLCMITLGHCDLDHCHLVPQGTSTETISKLEYLWGMQPRTFNINSVYNVVLLRIDIHHAFIRHAWTLVPEKTILERIINWQLNVWGPAVVKPHYLEAFPLTNTWEYVFFPFLELGIITRQRRAVEDPSVLRGFDGFEPPYTGFPHVRSHVHPFAVVFHVALVMRERHCEWLASVSPEHMELHSLLFRVWTFWDQQVQPPSGRPEESLAEGPGGSVVNNGSRIRSSPHTQVKPSQTKRGGKVPDAEPRNRDGPSDGRGALVHIGSDHSAPDLGVGSSRFYPPPINAAAFQQAISQRPQVSSALQVKRWVHAIAEEFSKEDPELVENPHIRA